MSMSQRKENIWKIHKLGFEIKFIEDTQFPNQKFESSNGVTGVFMLLCAKHTNGIKLFMRRSCLLVSRPIFNL
jgi:hypothetical protein